MLQVRYYVIWSWVFDGGGVGAAGILRGQLEMSNSVLMPKGMRTVRILGSSRLS